MYLTWAEKTITDFSEANIETWYEQGFLFTRVAKGIMKQTRSVRIDLNKFAVSSENRRMLRKTENLKLDIHTLPYSEYEWTIGKLGKDFYDTKFGDKTFSANKIKELMTDPGKSNFNTLFRYSLTNQSIGYCVAYQSKNILHYCYPFYNLEKSSKDTGLGMMIRAVIWAKEQNNKYLYLGSAQRPGDTYKFQFNGIEWFDGKKWNGDIAEIKTLLQNIPEDQSTD
ncbi:MAG: hypothetical protein Q7S24_01750 [bacterium]|nr:hypothetical protein [bacterium]